MAAQLERISKIRPLRAFLAAGGLAVLLLVGVVASPASAQDYPTPPTDPTTSTSTTVTTPTSVDVTEVNRTNNLPRTGSDNTVMLAVVGIGVVAAGTGLVVLGKRRAHQSGASA